MVTDGISLRPVRLRPEALYVTQDIEFGAFTLLRISVYRVVKNDATHWGYIEVVHSDFRAAKSTIAPGGRP